jgi:hypothetical protein
MLNAIRRTLTGEATLDEAIDAKVIATSLTALASLWIAGFAAKYGVVIGETDLPLVAVLIGPPIYAAVQFVVGYIKGDPRIGGLVDFYRRNGQEPPELAERTDEPTGDAPA